MVSVQFLGQEMGDLLTSIPSVPIQATGMIQDRDTQIQLAGDFWAAEHSPIRHIPLSGEPISVTVSGRQIYNGLVRYATVEPGLLTLTCQSALAPLLGQTVVATILQTTPAEAARQLLIAAGLSDRIVTESFSGPYSGWSCNVLLDKEDQATLGQALQACCDMGSAYLYTDNGRIYWRAPWPQITPGLSLSPEDMLSIPKISASTDRTTGWSLSYMGCGSLPAEGGTKEGQVWTADYSGTGPYQTTSWYTADAAGLLRVQRDGAIRQTVQVTVPIDHPADMFYGINLTWPEAGWNNTPGKIVGINRGMYTKQLTVEVINQ